MHKLSTTVIFLAIAMLLFSVEATADEVTRSHNVKHGVQFFNGAAFEVGLGTVKESQYILLYAPNSPKFGLEVTRRSSNFQKVQKWVMKNVFPQLNYPCKPTVPEDRSEFVLFLASKEKPKESDLLINVALNRNTLGEQFGDKIEELKLLMNDAHDVPN